ncbi:ABC transporter permease [Branchiibius cervicis]|uniref:ABC transporter permease n=1 Tax=Branchiibius cervicis TaxID=908252 RepID=A0ABW2AUA9_9MICO
MRATPASPSALLSAQFLLTAAVALVAGLLIVVLPAAFGAGAPGNPLGLLLAFVVMTVCLLSIGMVIASVFTRNKVAAAAGTVLFFVLAFLGGLWWPRRTMPGWMQTISDLSPAGAAVGSLQDALSGGWPGWSHLLVMLVWTVLLALLSVRLFRWE